MSDNSLDEGVALVLGKIILVAESENMTACELAWQNNDRLLCLQQMIRQSASKRKRKSLSYQKKTCCSCWTIKSRRYRFDLKFIQVTQEPQPAYGNLHANPQVCSRLFHEGWDKGHTRFLCLNQRQISDLEHRGYEPLTYQLVAEALTQQCWLLCKEA